MQALYAAILVGLVIFIITRRPAIVQAVNGSNHQLLNNMHFSTQEFYESVQQEIEFLQLKGLSFSRIVYPEGGIFSPRREYLRVRRREYVFDMCCAPFSKGTFVSWWLGEIDRFPFRKNLERIPIFGVWFQRRTKTYFELDNEAMFKELIKSAFNKVVAQFSEIKGIRPNLIDVPAVELPAMA